MEENTSGKGDRVDCDLIINNGYLLTMDKDQTSYPDGALAITGNAIVGVGSAKAMNAKFKPRLVMDARGGVVHPGLIDCHYHTGIHLARGAVPEDPSAETPITFYDWFNALEDGDEYVSALASCAEMVSHGYTAFMEPGTTFEPDAVAAAAEAIGIRASVADPFLWDIPEGVNTSVKRAPCDLKRALNLLGKELWRNNDPNSLIRAHVCAYGGGTASGELLLAAKDCADKNGVVLNQHHNFTVEQAEKDDKRFGGRHTLVRFADMGLIDQNCTFVHMNVIRDDEIDPIVKSGMSLVWVPGNYLFYGIASKTPCCMPQLLGKGANVTFGVDTAKIWSFGDMELIGYLAARQNDEYISPSKILEMRTVRAARALGLEDIIGSLEVGKRADLVMLSNDIPEALPAHRINIPQEMLLLSRSKAVDTVIVNGQIVFKNGSFTHIDEKHLYSLARDTARKMMHRIGK